MYTRVIATKFTTTTSFVYNRKWDLGLSCSPVLQPSNPKIDLNSQCAFWDKVFNKMYRTCWTYPYSKYIRCRYCIIISIYICISLAIWFDRACTLARANIKRQQWRTTLACTWMALVSSILRAAYWAYTVPTLRSKAVPEQPDEVKKSANSCGRRRRACVNMTRVSTRQHQVLPAPQASTPCPLIKRN